MDNLEKFVEILSNLPEKWSPAKSDKSPSSLARWFDSHLTRLGVETELEDKGDVFNEKYILEFDGARIVFTEKTYGCEINVTIKDKQKTKNLFLFWELWKTRVDKKEVWGGAYRTDLFQEHDSKKQIEAPPLILPWEHIPNPKENDERNAFVWCVTRISAEELASLFHVSKGAFSNSLKDMRKRQREDQKPKDAIIPEGKPSDERVVFFLKWEAYMRRADNIEKQKYKNKLVECFESLGGEERIKSLNLNWLS